MTYASRCPILLPVTKYKRKAPARTILEDKSILDNLNLSIATAKRITLLSHELYLQLLNHDDALRNALQKAQLKAYVNKRCKTNMEVFGKHVKDTRKTSKRAKSE